MSIPLASSYNGKRLTITDWLNRSGDNRVGKLLVRQSDKAIILDIQYGLGPSAPDPVRKLSDAQIRHLKPDGNDGFRLKFSDFNDPA